MIRNAAKYEELIRRYDRERLASMSYEEALRIFTALWTEARALGWQGTEDWRTAIEPDLAVARAINERFHRA